MRDFWEKHHELSTLAVYLVVAGGIHYLFRSNEHAWEHDENTKFLIGLWIVGFGLWLIANGRRHMEQLLTERRKGRESSGD